MAFHSPSTGFDQAFSILSNTRRRLALTYLAKQGGAANADELTDGVTSLETDGDNSDTTRKSVYSSLHQTHLPKLAEEGLVRRDDQRIELTRDGTKLVRYLTRDPSRDRRWSVYYLLSATVGALLVVMHQFHLCPLASWLEYPCVTYTVLTFALLTLMYTYQRYGSSLTRTAKLAQAGI